MKLVNNIINNREVHFKDLPIGTAYFDKNRAFCIKVNADLCLFLNIDDSWDFIDENPSAPVTPLDVTITIDGYKKIY